MQTQLREKDDQLEQDENAAEYEFHREVFVRAHESRPGRLSAAQVGESAFQAAPNRRERSKQTDDAAGGHCTRADVENVSAANFIRAHCPDGFSARWQCAGDVAAEKLDGGNQHEKI